MFDYICTSVAMSRIDIRAIQNRLHKQAKFNNLVGAAIFMAGIWSLQKTMDDHHTAKEIKELRREIKELKSAKGG